MRIDSIRAYAFGPFRDATLDLAPGLNVIYGPNEAGKSSWHAALYAGLCGMRRGRGANTTEDQQFGQRHRPWDGAEAWDVGTTITLENGRRVELRHDLGHRVGSQATDLATGRDVSNEIMFEGAPDGSKWLGLNRKSFQSVACVGQADILAIRDRDRANALQDDLQRAAATERAGSSAAAALLRIDDFAAEEVGSERAPTRPLLMARARVAELTSALSATALQHGSFLELSQLAALARSVTIEAEARAQAAQAALAASEAESLSSRLAAARELAAEFPQGEPPNITDDDETANEIATLLDRWGRRPKPVPAAGDTAAVIRARIADLEAGTRGDRETHESVRQAREALVAAEAMLGQTERAQPVGLTRPDIQGASADELAEYAAVLAAPRIVRAAPRRESPLWIIAAALLGLAGLAALTAGWIVPGVALLGVGVGAVAARFLLHRDATVPPTEDAADALRAELVARGLPQDADSLRALVQQATEFERREREIRDWEVRRDQQTQRTRAASESLRAALSARGVRIGALTPQEAWAAYDRACRERQALASQLPGARSDLARREHDDGAYAAALSTLAELEESLRRCAAACGLHPDGTPERLIAALQAWQVDRATSREDLTQRHERWGRLQALLDGGTLAELEGAEVTHRDRAAALAASVDVGELEAALAWLRSGHGASEVDALVEEARAEREMLTQLEEQRRLHPGASVDVASVEEDLESARVELARLEELADVLRETRGFIERAAERAHRNIAPVLRETVVKWLPRVTGGRYTDCLVAADSLEVKVRGESGLWRAAQLLSHGTEEQVYLLLRLALARHLTRSGEVCPLILDDVVAACDAIRKREVLDMLLELSSSFQVVLFTHETDVLEWAAERLVPPQHCLHVLDGAAAPA